MTPLHIAAQNGNLKIYHLIAKHLKEKNPPDNNGFTALHFAVHGRNFDVCKYILQKIEDKHPENVFRQTPLQAAMKNKYSLIVQLYMSKKTRRCLIPTIYLTGAKEVFLRQKASTERFPSFMDVPFLST